MVARRVQLVTLVLLTLDLLSYRKGGDEVRSVEYHFLRHEKSCLASAAEEEGFRRREVVSAAVEGWRSTSFCYLLLANFASAVGASSCLRNKRKRNSERRYPVLG